MIGEIETGAGKVELLSTDLRFRDQVGRARARLGSFRMRYTVNPSLYGVGKPDENSPVFVSANYKLSFDLLRRSLKGIDAFILVLDTRGINVWCAAGKGTFGTEELIKRIRLSGLGDVVRHRRLVIPQLGAPGIQAHFVEQVTGFRVYYGPVYARDIAEYLRNGYRATQGMRTVRFSFKDRLVLTPIETVQMGKPFLIYVLSMFVLFGLQPSGILFRDALSGGLDFVLLGAVSIVSGAVLTPLGLPVIPFRAFSLKGLVSGLVVAAVYYFLLIGESGQGVFKIAIIFMTYPVLSSYIALNFTGATPYTSISGVKKELKYALPCYILVSAATLVLFILHKLKLLELI
jgi:acetyl-CoA decarbonylase/synthase complex subunit gamma